MLEMKELVKRYGNFTAVDHLSLTVPDGSHLRLCRTQWRRKDHHYAHHGRAFAGNRRQHLDG